MHTSERDSYSRSVVASASLSTDSSVASIRRLCFDTLFFVSCLLLVLAIASLQGCSETEAKTGASTTQLSDNNDPKSELTFEYVRESNVSFGPIADSLQFTDASGNAVTLDDLASEKAVVLVITRGPITAEANGPVCPACTTQTARYLREYPEFAKRNVEVVVVYPQAGTGSDAFDSFIKQVRNQYQVSDHTAPFPIVFDYDRVAVGKLGLLSDPVKPSTFIFDAEHKLKFAYVGETPLQRPSVQAVLDEIDSWATPPRVGKATENVIEELEQPFAPEKGADEF